MSDQILINGEFLPWFRSYWKNVVFSWSRKFLGRGIPIWTRNLGGRPTDGFTHPPAETLLVKIESGRQSRSGEFSFRKVIRCTWTSVGVTPKRGKVYVRGFNSFVYTPPGQTFFRKSVRRSIIGGFVSRTLTVRSLVPRRSFVCVLNPSSPVVTECQDPTGPRFPEKKKKEFEKKKVRYINIEGVRCKSKGWGVKSFYDTKRLRLFPFPS